MYRVELVGFWTEEVENLERALNIAVIMAMKGVEVKISGGPVVCRG